MTRALTTDDVFDALHDAMSHLKRIPNAPKLHRTDDIPMMADLIRIVLDERGVVVAEDGS